MDNKKITIASTLIYLLFAISCSICDNSAELECQQNNNLGEIVSDFVHGILKTDGTLWMWGQNYKGTLGIGTLENKDIPTQVINIEDVVSFDTLEEMTVAIDKNGDIWFWGYSGAPTTTIVQPTKISNANNIAKIRIFGNDFYLLKNDGTIWKLEHNPYTPTKWITPTKVDQFEDICDISSSVALRKDGSLVEIFPSDPEYGGLPYEIYNVNMVCNHYNRRTVILKNDGTVWTWGKNDLGQLGNGTYIDSSTPTKINTLANVIAISANYDFNLALKDDGTVWFWGFAGRDENDKPFGINTPTKIEGLENIDLICAAPNCLGLKQDGTYWEFSAFERVPRLIHF